MKEVDGNVITYALRDTGEKQTVSKEQFFDTIHSLLENFQKRLFEKQKKFLEDNTHAVSSWDEFVQIMKTTRGFLRAFWCEDPACEAKIKEETKASTRCLPMHAKQESGTCVGCGKKAIHRWIFAQSY
jgi:prolyl-tRNA synthetase